MTAPQEYHVGPENIETLSQNQRTTINSCADKVRPTCSEGMALNQALGQEWWEIPWILAWSCSVTESSKEEWWQRPMEYWKICWALDELSTIERRPLVKDDR